MRFIIHFEAYRARSLANFASNRDIAPIMRRNRREVSHFHHSSSSGDEAKCDSPLKSGGVDGGGGGGGLCYRSVSPSPL